jgi:drug/metabolite transporter (DMT)-like permease
MYIPIPNSVQWMLAIFSVVTTVGYFIEKVPRLVQYFREPSVKDAPKSTSEYLVGSALALLCAAIWAASYASLDLISPLVGTLDINIHLMGFAAASLYVGSVVAARFKPASPPDGATAWQGGRLAILVVANLGNFIFSVWALSFISVSEAMTLNNLSPLLLALALWYRGKLTVSVGTFIALALVLLGAFIVNIDSGFVLRTGDNIRGSLIAVAAGASFALWTFTMDELRASFTSIAVRMRTLAFIFFVSYVVLITYGYFASGHSLLTTRDYIILSLNGVRVAFVHVLYTFAVQKAGALLASVILVLMVPLTFPFDNIWNQATISAQLIIGATLIVLAAVGLLSDELRRAQVTGSQ